MIEVVGLGALVLVGLAVCGILWAVASLLCWLFFLPFHILGFVFKGLAWLLALPFLLLAGVIGVVVFGAGMLVFFIPALPLVLVALFVWWLVRRRPESSAQVTT